MSMWGLILVALAVAALWWLAQRRTARPRHAQRAADAHVGHWPERAYPAVSIVPGQQACAAVDALSGVRHLCQEAPLVPLQDCTAPTCDCKYQHHSDRRQDSETRRAPGSLRTELHSHTGAAERRQERGRRQND